MTHSSSSWQRLRAESRITFTLALPIAIGQLASMAMSVVDTLLAGRHGPITLAAVAVGSAIWSLAMLICIGLMMAIPPTVSQLNGAGRRSEVGPVWRQALWLAFLRKNELTPEPLAAVVGRIRDAAWPAMRAILA